MSVMIPKLMALDICVLGFHYWSKIPEMKNLPGGKIHVGSLFLELQGMAGWLPGLRPVTR